MSPEDIFLSVAAVILFVAALGVGYYVLLEVIGVAGELAQSRRERRAQPSDHALRSPDDTIPMPTVASYRDRKTTRRTAKSDPGDQQFE